MQMARLGAFGCQRAAPFALIMVVAWRGRALFARATARAAEVQRKAWSHLERLCSPALLPFALVAVALTGWRCVVEARGWRTSHGKRGAVDSCELALWFGAQHAAWAAARALAGWRLAIWRRCRSLGAVGAFKGQVWRNARLLSWQREIFASWKDACRCQGPFRVSVSAKTEAAFKITLALIDNFICAAALRKVLGMWRTFLLERRLGLRPELSLGMLQRASCAARRSVSPSYVMARSLSPRRPLHTVTKRTIISARPPVLSYAPAALRPLPVVREWVSSSRPPHVRLPPSARLENSEVIPSLEDNRRVVVSPVAEAPVTGECVSSSRPPRVRLPPPARLETSEVMPGLEDNRRVVVSSVAEATPGPEELMVVVSSMASAQTSRCQDVESISQDCQATSFKLCGSLGSSQLGHGIPPLIPELPTCANGGS